MLMDSVLWRRLDLPGHDCCTLSETSGGYSLKGSAVFLHPKGPALLHYALELAHDWSTISAIVRGELGSALIDYTFIREATGWMFNRSPVPGLEAMLDLDLSFTPATNLQQLRRVDLKIGAAVDLPVAWFDIETRSLTRLAQRYERRGRLAYWYEAPTVPYKALLKLEPNGFVSDYPGLWRIEV